MLKIKYTTPKNIIFVIIFITLTTKNYAYALVYYDSRFIMISETFLP